MPIGGSTSWRTCGIGSTHGTCSARTSYSQQVLAAKIGTAVAAIPQRAALKRALDAQQDVAVSSFSDSTGDSDGAVAATDRIFARFARNVATAYADTHHVMFAGWNPTTDEFKPFAVLNDHPAGRRAAQITTRSLRFQPADTFASGNPDVRVWVNLPTLTPSATGTLAAQAYKVVAGARTPEFVGELRLHTSGNLYWRVSFDGTSWISSDRISTAAIGTQITTNAWWMIRVTCEVVPGTGYTTKFWTSQDGATFTQLGTAVAGGNASTVPLHVPAQGSQIELGASGWGGTVGA